jgi:hypothetical protein
MDIDDPGSEEQAERFREKIRGRAAEAGADAHVSHGERFKLISNL